MSRERTVIGRREVLGFDECERRNLVRGRPTRQKRIFNKAGSVHRGSYLWWVQR